MPKQQRKQQDLLLNSQLRWTRVALRSEVSEASPSNIMTLIHYRFEGPLIVTSPRTISDKQILIHA